jgi:hypothetical protein
MIKLTQNKKVNKIKIHASFALFSAYVQSQFLIKDCNEAKLNPLDE